jgi:hypothetical protein
MPRLVPLVLTSALLLPLLGGCDLLGGGESAEQLAARREAEGKAVGGACRHAGRAIEDCYAINKRSDKAAIFAGWREMNDYMRENQVEVVRPEGASTEVAAKEPVVEATPAAKPAAKPQKKDS